MNTTIGTRMQDTQRRALKTIAYALGLLVYLGGILYAEARAYSLFTRTIDPDLLPVAVVGIVALGLTAIAAPLAHHFGTAPGVQRIVLDLFYALDILAMGANAVLDAALHGSGDLTTLLAFWQAYILPALPLLCLVGWSLYFMLDPEHRQRDTLLAARAATEETLTARVIEQMKSADLGDLVDRAAQAAAAEIVGQTVGKPSALPTTASVTTTMSLPTTEPRRPSRNGQRAEHVQPGSDPNA